MLYSFDTQLDILQLATEGHSGRAIASMLGVSKSGVNDFLARRDMFDPVAYAEQTTYSDTSDTSGPTEPKANGPKILLFDLETSAALVYAFGRHKIFVNQDAVAIEGGKILMASYRWLHEDTTNILVDKEEIRAGSDYEVTKQLWDLFEQADAVVAHNGRNFDVKMLEAACLRNDLPPLPTVHILDTLEIAKKKFRLPSNKLDSLAAFLDIGRKVTHSGIDLWAKVQQGDEKAIEEMVEYCLHDTDLLLEVFLYLRSRGLVSGFNAANYYDDNKMRCKTCGSVELENTGRTVTTPTGRFEELRCRVCDSVQRDKENLNTKEKRKSLTASPKN